MLVKRNINLHNEFRLDPKFREAKIYYVFGCKKSLSGTLVSQLGDFDDGKRQGHRVAPPNCYVDGQLLSSPQHYYLGDTIAAVMIY